MIFDLYSIERETGKKITGAIHVGAFVGEELNQYRNLGLCNTILFEPQPNLYKIVKDKCLIGEKVYNVALGSEKCQKEMSVSWRAGGGDHGCGASSSLLKPKKHLIEHPEVTFPETIIVDVHTLDDYYETGYNFLNVDVQGYELEVLRGGIKMLGHIDTMILEVNRDEVYEGCPMIEDIDAFLSDLNFDRIAVHWQSDSWGDAVYAKRQH